MSKAITDDPYESLGNAIILQYVLWLELKMYRQGRGLLQ